ncbi:MAG: hypothetical protein ACRDIF_01655, partial [Actinomycetota bacterium]
MALTDTVISLAEELRRSGVPVSLVETADAIQALTKVPLERRPVVKAALASTLVKESGARRVFDRLFDIFFPPPKGAGAASRNEASEQITDLRSRLSRAIRERDAEALRDMAEELVEEEAGIQPNANVSDDHYRYRALRGLDMEDLLARLVEQDVAGRGLSAMKRRLIEEDFEERMQRFAEQVTEEIQRRRRAGLDLGQQLVQQRREPPE